MVQFEQNAHTFVRDFVEKIRGCAEGYQKDQLDGSKQPRSQGLQVRLVHTQSTLGAQAGGSENREHLLPMATVAVTRRLAGITCV